MAKFSLCVATCTRGIRRRRPARDAPERVGRIPRTRQRLLAALSGNSGAVGSHCESSVSSARICPLRSVEVLRWSPVHRAGSSRSACRQDGQRHRSRRGRQGAENGRAASRVRRRRRFVRHERGLGLYPVADFPTYSLMPIMRQLCGLSTLPCTVIRGRTCISVSTCRRRGPTLGFAVPSARTRGE